jgi:hypothetical protein
MIAILLIEIYSMIIYEIYRYKYYIPEKEMQYMSMFLFFL